MEKYQKPELYVIKFRLNDVISASGSDASEPTSCRDNDCVETIIL